MAATSARTVTDEELAGTVARRAQSAGAMAPARDAFEQLYRRHAHLLLAFLAARVRRADLDDLHQDVWRRAWQHLPDGFRGGQFRAWLYQIARNALIDHARKKRPDPLDEGGDVPDRRDGGPDRHLIEHERAEALRRCLGRLEAGAEALVRARLSGEDYAEIHRKLGLAPVRAHKAFHKAKALLKDCVERALA
jgi:RNA polymerase sigma-70 factor (ECF subfamily)